MTRQLLRMVFLWLCLATLAGCAAKLVTVPAPALGTAEPAPPLAAPVSEASPYPPPAEMLSSFALVREYPAVAAATAALADAPGAVRPAALMRRAREAVAAAHGMRMQPDGPFFVPAMATDYPRYLAFYELAERDLEELLLLHADAPAAAEALFMSGLICDYPHLERFDEAVAAYRETIARFPGSEWAGRSRERILVLEEIMGAGTGGPPGAPSPGQPPPK